LQYSGLNAALRAYCSEFAALAGIRVAFHSNGSFADTPPATALCAYRITQEGLQNIVKHAQTHEARLR
jgi:signal transduction histidine kinase